MEATQKEKNIKVIKDVLKQYLQDKSYRNTPERYAILEEIYNMDHHFNVDDLYLIMINKKYHVSKATIYNTIEIFLDAGLIRKHQFGEKTMSSSSYEKSYFDKQHDHLVIYKDGSDVHTDTNTWHKAGEPRARYGSMRVKGVNKKPTDHFAHRTMYQIFKGQIPNKYHVDHLCRNPKCCYHRHLEAVTVRENILRIHEAMRQK